jgi:hypothetical protein
MSQDDEMNFERADYNFRESDGAFSQNPRSGSANAACSVCQSPVFDAYFTRNGDLVCTRCEAPVRAVGPSGSAVTRFSGAGAIGIVAAAIASALWMLVTELTGYEIGLMAIAVGWIIGVAVNTGSRGVGGLPYQLLAVFLSYSAIVATYVPMLARQFQQGPEAIAEPIAAWLFAIPVAYAMPFLSGFENIIGVFIIGFGLWQAWTLTARVEAVWDGPFRVGDESTS